MDTIYIKRKPVPGDSSKTVFVVPAVGIKTTEGMRLIPHPYGMESTSFETLEETIEQVHRAGYDGEYEGQLYPLPVRIGRQASKSRTAAKKPNATGLHLVFEAIPSLLNQLKDNSPSVIAQAAFALGELRDDRAIPGLIHAFSHEDANVRKQAAEAIAKLGRVTLSSLQNALRDKHWLVRHTAIQALIDLLGVQPDLVNELIPDTLPLLKDESWLVRSQAATFFGEAAKLHRQLSPKEI